MAKDFPSDDKIDDIRAFSGAKKKIELKLEADASVISLLAIDNASLSAPVDAPDFIDGMLIPRGACTLFAARGGLGKTTSLLTAALNAAADGRFSLFGMRDHGRPLRVLIVSGEGSIEHYKQTFQREIPGGMEKLAAAGDRLKIIHWPAVAEQLGVSQPVFGRDGEMTESGSLLIESIMQHAKNEGFDVIIFDTLASLSSGDFLGQSEAYRVLGRLNVLAERTGAAVIMTHHTLTKGDIKIGKGTEYEDLIGTMRGSSSLIDASRHTIVVTKAPADLFDGAVLMDRDDELLAAAVKSNIPGFRFAQKVIPIQRSACEKTLISTRNGRPISDEMEEMTKELKALLKPRILDAVQYMSNAWTPLAETGQNSVHALYDLALAPIFDIYQIGDTSKAIQSVIARLIRDGDLVSVRPTLTGTRLIDYPGGPFDKPALNEKEIEIDGKPKKVRPKFEPGGIDAVGLERYVAALDEERRAWDRDYAARQDARIRKPEAEAAYA